MSFALVLLLLLPQDIAELIKKLRATSDLSQRYQIESELGRALKAQQVPLILREIDAGPADLRPHFIRVIRHVGSREALDSLRGLLTRYEVRSRVEAAYAMKVLGEDSAMKMLPAELARPNLAKEDKLAILQYLYAFYTDAKEVPPALRTVLTTDKDADVRRMALNALITHKDADSTPTLWKMADDESDSLRAEALAALIRLGDPKAVDRGLSLLESGKVPTNGFGELIFALRLVGGREIADRLRALLEKTTGVSAQIQLISTLGELRDTKSIVLFIHLSDDKSNAVAEAALGALVELGGRSQLPLLKRLLSHKDPSRRLKAAEALATLDDTSGIPILCEILGDKKSHLRLRATTALGFLRVPDIVQPLITALGDEEVNVRQQASTHLVDVFQQLYPYRRFDYAAVKYDPQGTDIEARKSAIARIQAWWEERK